ncbi:MAG: ATP-binding protein [Candidatus Omnitrophica bacterium]|nr:ATP-binding protein [Candidatus Omnitrophota bacterium]
MKNNEINILVIEDNPADLRLVIELLKESINPFFKLTHAKALAEATKEIIKTDFDVVLLDLDLPDSNGLDTLKNTVKQAPGMPAIVLTGVNDESLGIQAIHEGACDYLVKGHIDTDLLVRSIKYAIERKRIEEYLAGERRNLQMIFDVVNVGMLLIDDHGVVKRINNVVERWSGKSFSYDSNFQPGDILGCIHALNEPQGCGHTPHCAVCPIRKAFESVLNDGQAVHSVETEATIFINGSKVKIWLDISADPVVIGGKKHVIIAINNITERKRNERKLQNLNRTLRALSDSNEAMMRASEESDYLNQVCRIIIEDCGHSMVWIGVAENDEAKSVRPVAQSGFDEGYLNSLKVTWSENERGRGPTGTAIRTGKPAMCKNMLTDPAFAPWREEALKRGYSSSIVFPLFIDSKVFGAITIYSREPDPFSEEEIKLLEELADDLSYGIMSVRLHAQKKQIEDILKRDNQTLEALVRERSQELIKAQAELEKSKRLSDIGTLAATVAHELRNPLAAIKLAAFNIKRKTEGLAIEKHIVNINTKVFESEQIINNLLFYSKIKVSRFQSINARDLLNESVDEASKRSQGNTVSLTQDTGSIQDLFIEADPVQLKEVFINILNNAFDALFERNDPVIEVRARVSGRSLLISIKDNGSGIDKENQERVFEPFFTTKSKGTGLGLAVCNQIIMLHDGTINLASQKGEGTTITVSLPIDRTKTQLSI